MKGWKEERVPAIWTREDFFHFKVNNHHSVAALIHFVGACRPCLEPQAMPRLGHTVHPTLWPRQARPGAAPRALGVAVAGLAAAIRLLASQNLQPCNRSRGRRHVAAIPQPMKS